VICFTDAATDHSEADGVNQADVGDAAGQYGCDRHSMQLRLDKNR
jgi:hypothetical protein